MMLDYKWGEGFKNLGKSDYVIMWTLSNKKPNNAKEMESFIKISDF